MRRPTQNILYFIAGIFVSLICNIVFIIIGIYFWLLKYGYEPLEELKDFLYKYCFLIGLVFLLSIFFYLIKKRHKFFARGLLFGFLPIFICVALNTYDVINYYSPTKFDSNKWKRNVLKPYDMSRTILWNHLAIGKTKKEIISLFGKDYINDYSDDTKFSYRLDIANFSYFEIHFDKSGRSVSVTYNYHD